MNKIELLITLPMCYLLLTLFSTVINSFTRIRLTLLYTAFVSITLIIAIAEDVEIKLLFYEQNRTLL